MRRAELAVLISGLVILSAVPAQGLPEAGELPSSTDLHASESPVGPPDLDAECIVEAVPGGPWETCTATWEQGEAIDELHVHRQAHASGAVDAQYSIKWIDADGNRIFEETCNYTASGRAPLGVTEWFVLRSNCQEHEASNFERGTQKLVVRFRVTSCSEDPCPFHGGFRAET